MATHGTTDWNAYARDYDALLLLKPYRALVEMTARAAAQDNPARCLDAGCGTGNTMLALHQLTTAEITGVDRAPSMLARARGKNSGAHLALADVNHTLPFANNTFDAIVCVNTLYAVHDPLHTLDELRRLLQPEGRLVLATPRRGYENGFILKEHCGSQKPDAYWKDAHRTPEREEALIREALPDERAAQAVLAITEANRRIARNGQFHFLTKHQLLMLIAHADLKLLHYREAYARQLHFVIVSKGGNRS